MAGYQKASLLFALVCLLSWSVNSFYLDQLHLPISSIKQPRSFKVREYRFKQYHCESSSENNISAKYQVRSKLLEIALQKLREDKNVSNNINKLLEKQLFELSTKYDINQRNTSQIMKQLKETKSDKLETNSRSKLVANQLETEQIKNHDLVADIKIYKSRLIILENVYRESQEAIRIVKKDHCAEIENLEVISRKKRENEKALQESLLSMARKEIDGLKAILTEKEHKLLTLEKLRQQENQFAVSLEDEMRQLLIAIDQIKEEKAQSEDCHRAETEKFELKEKYMVELQVENNRMETDRKTYILNETFAQFWNNNLLKEKQIKIAEEQANLQKDMLDRQQAVLDETSRLLFAATTAVTEMSLATQRPSPTSAPVSPAAAVIASTSVLTSTSAFERELKADLKDQTRLLRRQTELLEQLLLKISLAPMAATASNLYDASSIRRSGDVYSNNSDDSNNNEDVNDDTNNSEVVVDDNEEKFSDENNDRVQTNKDESEVDATSDTSQSRSRFFNSFFSRITGLSDIEQTYPQSIDSKNEDKRDGRNSNKENKKENREQEKRLRLARRSGRILGGLGKVLVKSVTDTVGFWVGLGLFDDDDDSDNNGDSYNEESSSYRKRYVIDNNDGYDQSYNKYDDFRNRNYNNKNKNNQLITDCNTIDMDSSEIFFSAVTPEVFPLSIDYDDYIDSFGAWNNKKETVFAVAVVHNNSSSYNQNNNKIQQKNNITSKDNS